MDEVFGKILASLILSLFSVALANIKSDDVTDKIMRAVSVCEKALLEHLNAQIHTAFSDLGNKINWEFNRILSFVVNKNKNFTIEQTELEIAEPTMQISSLYFSKRVFQRIRKLEYAATRINAYKVAFWIMLVCFGFFTLLHVFNIYPLKDFLLNAYLAFSIIVILIYLLDRIIISNLIKSISKDYGLS